MIKGRTNWWFYCSFSCFSLSLRWCSWRCFLAALAAYYMIGLRDTDVIYSPLPLYHLASGILGSCQAALMNVTVILKPKFSVSKYWTDCIKYKVTVRSLWHILISFFEKVLGEDWRLVCKCLFYFLTLKSRFLGEKKEEANCEIIVCFVIFYLNFLNLVDESWTVSNRF